MAQQTFVLEGIVNFESTSFYITTTRTLSAVLRKPASIGIVTQAGSVASAGLPEDLQVDVAWAHSRQADSSLEFLSIACPQAQLPDLKPVMLTAVRHSSSSNTGGNHVAKHYADIALTPQKGRFLVKGFGWSDFDTSGHSRRIEVSLFLTCLWAPFAQPNAHDLPCYSLTNNDVVFVFPFEPLPRYLWANVRNLSAASPFFATMFSSGFSEENNQLTEVNEWSSKWKASLQRIIREAREGARTPAVMPDSDTEDMPFILAKSTKPDQRESSSLGAPSLRYVIVKDAPYRTYEATFRWLLTGSITFAKLTSARLPDQDKACSSPKSVYRLAHQLEFHDLRKIALANYRQQLTADNVVSELFSTICTVYPELKETALTVLQQRWAEVRQRRKLDQLDIMLKAEVGLDSTELAKLLIEVFRRCSVLSIDTLP